MQRTRTSYISLLKTLYFYRFWHVRDITPQQNCRLGCKSLKNIVFLKAALMEHAFLHVFDKLEAQPQHATATATEPQPHIHGSRHRQPQARRSHSHRHTAATTTGTQEPQPQPRSHSHRYTGAATDSKTSTGEVR